MENKLDYKKTFILGFGFFAISITWNVYNAFMPLLLGKFIESAALIGFIMTIDNYLALFIQPAVGFYSDGIKTKFGRRMPFIMVGMPLAAIFMFMIPFTNVLWTLVLALFLMNLSMSIYRSPVIALMPDLTPKPQRSKANAIINFMGGIGSLIAFIIGGKLYEVNEGFPFFLSAALIVFSFVVLFIQIKEQRDVLQYEQAEEKRNLGQGILKVIKDKNALFLLFAITSWFIGYNGIETFFTKYGQSYLNIKPSQSTITLAFISLSFLIFAIPAGIIGTKIGKKNTIRFGIVGAIIMMLGVYFVKPDTVNMLLYIRILFLGIGFSWAAININSYPYLADMSPLGLLGTYTGVYYLFSSIANIISPPLLGKLIDLIGYNIVFLYGAFWFTMAFIFINLVFHKEKEEA